MSVAFQVQAVIQRGNDFGLTRAGQTRNQNRRYLLDRLIQRVYQEATHGFVAADNSRILHASIS